MGSCDDSALDCDFSRPFDLCIIGSGAAGITIAHKLRNSNRRICVLESSTFNEPQRASVELVQKHESTSSAAAQEALTADPALRGNPDGHRFEDPVAQTLYQGELTQPMLDIDKRFLTRSRIRVFGGTTNCWGGWTRPLSTIDFDRSDMNPAWKWPITRKDLLPYYQEALQYCALDRPGYPIVPDDYEDPDLWPSRTDDSVAPLPSKTPYVRTAIFTAMNGEDSGGVKNGSLDFQCVYGPALKAAGVCVARDVSVRGFEVSADGSRITAANAQRIDRSGPEPRPGAKVQIQAKQFVLAVGGIEGPRLLLMAKNGGLGNSAGHLGRYFMIHPVIENAQYFSGSNTPDMKVRGFYRNWPATRMKGDLAPGFWATYVPTDEAMRKYRIGSFRMIVDYYSGGGGKLNLNWEQFPNPHSIIDLSSQKDLFGDPRVKVDWRMTQDDLRTRDVAVGMVIEELKKWGYADEREGTFGPMIPGDHHMGATKMSALPKNGYVNPDCRLHEIANLYIASSSVMPTGGSANVTLTIIALALRLADHLSKG